MKSFTTTAFGIATLVSDVMGHGYIVSPPPRQPGEAMVAACGKQVTTTFQSDINGNIQGVLQVANSQQDYDAAKCNIWTCKGMQFDDNKANVQTWTAGEKVPMTVKIAAPHTGTANVSIIDTATSSTIGEPLVAWSVYASTARGSQANETSFDVTIPSDLGSKCSTAGACALQWWWDSREADQTYEGCIDFTVGGSGSGSGSNAPAPTPASSQPAATKPASSTAVSATAVATPVNNAQTSTSAVPTAAPSSTGTPSQGSAMLPEQFTAEQFISWFKQVTGVKNGRRSLNRPHARAF